MEINKWNQYLTIRQFVVKTNQKDLKYLLKQKLHTGSQLKWVAKLMQFDFVIEYTKGKENIAADALSRLPIMELASLTLSSVKTDILKIIKANWYSDIELTNLIQQVAKENTDHQGYTFLHGQLRKKGKLVIGPD